MSFLQVCFNVSWTFFGWNQAMSENSSTGPKLHVSYVKKTQQVVQGWPAGLSQANILSFPPQAIRRLMKGFSTISIPPVLGLRNLTFLWEGVALGWHWPLRFSWNFFSPSIHRSFLWSFFSYRLRIGWIPSYLGWIGLCTPWKINGWNLQPSPMKRKENDRNQTYLQDCVPC